VQLVDQYLHTATGPEMGEAWRFPRKIHAHILNIMMARQEAQVSTVCLDKDVLGGLGWSMKLHPAEALWFMPVPVAVSSYPIS